MRFFTFLREHKVVEEVEVIEPPCVPLEDRIFEVFRWNWFAVLLEVGTFQEFPNGKVVLLQMVLDRNDEDAHVTPPFRFRP